jgi:molybdenum cofactor sulfurtransferase
VAAHAAVLGAQLAANPHSTSAAGRAMAARIDAARAAVLNMFGIHSSRTGGTATHDVVFTAGATDALRLVAHSVPWSPTAVFAYLRSAHTSLLGIRAVAQRAGAHVVCVDRLLAAESGQVERGTEGSAAPWGLFAVTGQCNLSGRRYALDMLSAVKAGRAVPDGVRVNPWVDSGPLEAASVAGAEPMRQWLTLLDAASLAGSGPPDLSAVDADLTVVSFYKVRFWALVACFGLLTLWADVRLPNWARSADSAARTANR